MKTKPKKCRGIGKSKGNGCGELKIIMRYGLCPDCFRKWLLCTDEGKEVLKNSTITSRNKIEKTKKKEARIKKEVDRVDSISIAKLIQEVRRPFQKLIRIRDNGQKCICCNVHLSTDIGGYDGGHFMAAEKVSALIFNPDNCHGQRVYCNKICYGNQLSYSVNLPLRIGIDRYEELFAIKEKFPTYKWDKKLLLEMKAHYLNELRQVESGKDIIDVDFACGIVK
jgi:hypothetical protein